MFDARSILDALVRGGGHSPRGSEPASGGDIFRDLLGQLAGGDQPRVPPQEVGRDRFPTPEQPPAHHPDDDDEASGQHPGRMEADEGDDEAPPRSNTPWTDSSSDDDDDEQSADTHPPRPGSQSGGASLEDLLRDVLGGRPGSGGTGGGGGLQDMLRDILGGGQAGPGSRMVGDSGQAGGGGALLETLRQVLGQATSGVREGAGRLDEMTGASGRARDAFGQATGQSPDELIAKLRELLASNRLGAGAALGGLGALILGTGAGRSLAGSAIKLGGLALIGGLAYKAYQNYQQGLPPIGGARPGPPPAQQLIAAPRGSGFEADAVTHDAAVLYIRAMIAAAAADGRIDATERQKIMGGLQQAGLDAEAQQFLEGEINKPATIEELAEAVSSELDAVQVYTAARIAIDVDTGAEHAFLAQLAEALEIDPTLAAQVDAAARSAAA